MCRIASSHSRCIAGMKVARMNFLTSGYSTKTLLGAGTNSMAMNKTINAEVFGVYELGSLIEGFSLEIDAL